MLAGNESLFWDIQELIADCRDCQRQGCPDWCREFVWCQVRDVVNRAKQSPEYVGRD